MKIETPREGGILVKTDHDQVLVNIRDDGTIYVNAVGDVHVGDGGTKNVILTAEKTVYTKFQVADRVDWDPERDPPQYEWDALNRLARACSLLGIKP